METLPYLRKELQQEYDTTKKFLSLFPDGKNEYAPHEKSMKLMPLATHIVEIFGWPHFMLTTGKLDFESGEYQPAVLTDRAGLEQKFEEEYAKSKETLNTVTEEDLNGRWTMNMGDHLIADYNKYEAIRVALNQITHHRAQLGLYYRLMNIPLPGSYGPTADDESF
jgi:uncharacterized damage-inducible protein DinB